MKKFLGVVCMNVVLFGFLVFLMNVGSITAVRLVNLISRDHYDHMEQQPNYKNSDWAKTHFEEYLSQGSEYQAFYGWRRPPYKGETINVDENGLRATFESDRTPTRTIAFFGGSTTWGVGARDNETIPSFFARMNPEYRAYNFGDQGYVSHQSVNLFLRWYFQGFRPDVVVFYDGANEPAKCRDELDEYSHARENKIRTTLHEAGAGNPESVGFLILPTKNFIEKVLRVANNELKTSFYDCDKDPAKTERVARVLLSDWRLVKNIVEGYGGKFVAILQPVAFFSKTKTAHLKLDPELGRQYQVVYSSILDLLPKEFPDLEENFEDLRTAFDRDDYIFYDWYHVSPNGNQIIAQRVTDIVQRRMEHGVASNADGRFFEVVAAQR